MNDVYIIGSYSTQFKRWPEKTYRDLARDVYLGVLADAGMADGSEIEFGYFGNCAMNAVGQNSIRGQVTFIPLVREGLFPDRVPLINVEGACATASMAFHSGWKDILSGQSQVVLTVGMDKFYFPEQAALMLQSFSGGMDRITPEDTVSVYEEAGRIVGNPFQSGPDRSFFMDTYAMQALYYMWKHGVTQRQIAVGAAKNHNFGARNPKAQYRFEMTVDQVLADRPISYPLTRSMCAPIGDGAAAAILCSEEYLKTCPPEVQNRAVKIRASVLTGGKYRGFDEPSLSHAAAQKAYKMAGLKPADIHVAEVHDATSFCEIYQVEMMGFSPIGQGGRFVEEGQTSLGGKIPINTSGGLVSKGHPVGATGLGMINELVTQLREEAGERQVKGATLALQENGGGVIGFEEAACSVIILEKV